MEKGSSKGFLLCRRSLCHGLLIRSFDLIKNILPQKLKQIWIRSKLKIDPIHFKDVVFKIAETRDELEQAYKLLYKVFRAKNLVIVNSSEMKITKLDVLPTTKMLIAVRNGEVQSCLSLSFEGVFRTPSEEHFDLNFIKKQNKAFIELSHFAIEPQISHFHEDFLLPLCRLALELNTFGPRAEFIVTSLSPGHFDYFKAVFGLRRLSEQSNLFEDFNSRPAICAFSEINELKQNMKIIYGEKPSSRNLFYYLFEASDSRLKVEMSEELFSAEDLNYFFNTKTDILATLTSFEKRNIHHVYFDQKYRELFPRPAKNTAKDRSRIARRYEVEASGEILKDGAKIASVTIKTVSIEGLGIIASENLALDAQYSLYINKNAETRIELLVTPVWSSRDHAYGLVIRKSSANWISFVEAAKPKEQQAS
jgi:hypothetical protein